MTVRVTNTFSQQRASNVPRHPWIGDMIIIPPLIMTVGAEHITLQGYIMEIIKQWTTWRWNLDGIGEALYGRHIMVLI